MRIIGGFLKGRRIQPPKGLDMRPTTDRARESLFNILAHRFPLEGARVLDGFSGSGAVAFEFRSRGAAHVTAVDRNPAAVRFIRQAAQTLGVAAEIKAVQADVQAYLARASQPFHLAFFDPPYALPDKYRLVQVLWQRALLSPDGLVVLEHPKQESYDALPGFQDRRAYGLSVFSFFGWPDPAAAQPPS